MDAPLPPLIVNGVTVDFGRGRLTDAAGAEVPLRPRAFALLRHLAERPGQLVSKDALIAAVWGGVAVTDDSLVQCVGDIRRALGDAGHTVLRTVPRRGYRLVPPPAGRVQGRRWRLLAAGLAALAAAALAVGWRGSAPPPSVVPLVAVLPFEAVADEPVAARLAAGLAADIRTDLARFPEFGVLSAGAAGAAFVIRGAVAGVGERVRVTAEVVVAAEGRQLWSSRWDRPSRDLLAVQSEIAEAIGNALGGGAGLVQEEGRRRAKRIAWGDRSAYDHYLVGTEKLERVTVPDVTDALVDLERAVALDPGFARAWVELFHARNVLAKFGVEPKTNLSAAWAAAEQALALDPTDAEAHAVMGMTHIMRGDPARGRAAMEAAIRLGPNVAEILTFYAATAATLGEAARGAEMADRALALDPGVPDWAIRVYAHAYFMAGRHAEALAMVERLPPETYAPVNWVIRVAALAALGREAEGAAWVARARAARPDLTAERMAAAPELSPPERRHYAGAMRAAGFPD